MEEDFLWQDEGRQVVPGTTAGAGSPGFSGFPSVTGGTIGTVQPGMQLMPLNQEQVGLYTQGYLQTLIGKQVRIQFLLGENSFEDRRGQILGVGIDYVLLKERGTNDVLLCDLYSIKFVITYL